jgi:hypothetical protein
MKAKDQGSHTSLRNERFISQAGKRDCAPERVRGKAARRLNAKSKKSNLGAKWRQSVVSRSLADLTVLALAHDHDRALAARFAPLAKREGLLFFIAFDHELERLAALVSEPALRRIRLRFFHDALERGESEGAPLLQEALGVAAGNDSLRAKMAELAMLHGEGPELGGQGMQERERGGRGDDMTGGDSREGGERDYCRFERRRQELLFAMALAHMTGRPHDELSARAGNIMGLALCPFRHELTGERRARAMRAAQEEVLAERPIRLAELEMNARIALLPLALAPSYLRRFQGAGKGVERVNAPSRWLRLWLLWRAARKAQGRHEA